VKTYHRLVPGDARDLSVLDDASVQLICTSPPYPMIQMWDALFADLDGQVAVHLEAEEAWPAWEAMHKQLDRTYEEAYRVLEPGCFAVVNMGDATRTVAGDFQLFPNHARVIQGMLKAGFSPLPDILWRKPTNSPNKFMGSGMLPAGAYVTYEHEYILVFRKGSKRVFSTDAAKQNRRESAFFWEERNRWFSDVWQDVAGAGQDLPSGEARSRSAAFPIRIPWRIIQMFSVYGDTVLDPFLGTGTTMAAAAASGRNSVGFELAESLFGHVEAMLDFGATRGLDWGKKRVVSHLDFIAARTELGKPIRHRNATMDLPVMTKQEQSMVFYQCATKVQTSPHEWVIRHCPIPKDQLVPIRSSTQRASG